MRSHPFILGFFFLLSIVTSSSPALAKIGEMSVTRGEGPVDIEADELTFERETQTYEAHGQVEVNRGDFSLKADHVRLNMATKEMIAWGNVLLREGEDVIECQRLEVNLDTRLGRIYQARLFLKEQNFHITGQEVEKLGENHYRIRESVLTTCDEKRPPWKFSAKELEVREMALGGWGTAKGSIFYLEDIPVLYFPWAALPVRQERQSGFLIPRAGYSSGEGFRFYDGFYWAFAKNMDATLYLDYLGTRGFKEGLEYRYAFGRETKGQANFNFIDDQDYGKNRYSVFVQHDQKLPYDFYLKADVNVVSDNDYLRDFTTEDHYTPISKIETTDAWSTRQLRSVVFGGKNWDQFSLLGQAAVWDNLAVSSNDETLQKLPQVSFFVQPQSLFKTPLFFDLVSSYTNFWREKGVEAQRGDLFPRISFPTRLFNVLKFEADAGWRGSVYDSQNDPTNTIKGWRSRELFVGDAQLSTEFYRVYSADGISKLSSVFNVDKWMHTIEPTVTYTYIPRVNQTLLPAFDEVDQIPYTNQVTYGITQRLVGRPEKVGVSSGPFEYANLTISQSYSLGDPFTNSNGKSGSFSNIQGELWLNFGPYLSAHCDGELNPYRGSFDIFNFAIFAKDRRNDAVMVQYRDTRGTDKEINIDARVKTIPPLYLFGSFYYNLLAGTWVQAIFGAEYQAQCWSAGFFVEGINESPDGTQKKHVKYHFYVNLLNLGSTARSPALMRY
ncbi:MAG TPA: LPS assembly protein LptD [Thermodesulfobacteriota bacterium]|nr:LPS assembly protein LptD [Thermodesulfobacteriota bacterium]